MNEDLASADGCGDGVWFAQVAGARWRSIQAAKNTNNQSSSAVSNTAVAEGGGGPKALATKMTTRSASSTARPAVPLRSRARVPRR